MPWIRQTRLSSDSLDCHRIYLLSQQDRHWMRRKLSSEHRGMIICSKYIKLGYGVKASFLTNLCHFGSPPHKGGEKEGKETGRASFVKKKANRVRGECNALRIKAGGCGLQHADVEFKILSQTSAFDPFSLFCMTNGSLRFRRNNLRWLEKDDWNGRTYKKNGVWCLLMFSGGCKDCM